MATARTDIENKIRKDEETSEKEVLQGEEVLTEKLTAQEIKQSSEEDLESLLKLAEELKRKVEKTEEMERRFFYAYRLIQAFSFLLLVYSLIYFFYVDPLFLLPFGVKFILDLISLASAIIFSPLIFFYSQHKIKILKISSLSDKLALKEVLQLLREVHGTIAEREDWSVLKRAEFRIRLSRFDLSEKKASAFKFFP